ncbi:MAG: hypothetical protein QOH81_2367 [Sphingomonadales bacterium]|jgi:hypothetical protein|nr:hypothetical protein [Sphingomonadales bacterium]
MVARKPLPSMGRGRGGVSYETRFAAGDITPTMSRLAPSPGRSLSGGSSSPIGGEGFRAMAR